jgi:hypothetical protein
MGSRLRGNDEELRFERDVEDTSRETIVAALAG